MTAVIRSATAADAAGIAAVFAAVAPEGWLLLDPVPDAAAVAAMLAQQPPTRHTWVAEDPHTQTVVATAEAVQGPTAATRGVVTVALAVLPAFRRQGLGHRLMEAMESWARAQGAHKISLACLSTNTPAQALYQRRGYVIEGRWVRHYWVSHHWVDAIWYAKMIRSDTDAT